MPPGPWRGFSRHGALRRLDRAAARLNPLLALVVIGLTILNLIAIGGLVPHLKLTRIEAGGDPCQAKAVANPLPRRPDSL